MIYTQKTQHTLLCIHIHAFTLIHWRRSNCWGCQLSWLTLSLVICTSECTSLFWSYLSFNSLCWWWLLRMWCWMFALLTPILQGRNDFSQSFCVTETPWYYWSVWCQRKPRYHEEPESPWRPQFESLFIVTFPHQPFSHHLSRDKRADKS